MITRLKEFEEKTPEIVFEWDDPLSEAKGWVVINSLRGGAAGGGTRMRKGLEKEEVIALAKTMEIKFTVSGPPIGGAKSGINFDPKDPRKEGVLFRWYGAVKPLLKYYYGTGGDLNVDEVHEVIPITEDHGIWHPQEGVFQGHFQPTQAQIVNRIGQLRQGVTKVIENPDFTPDLSRKYTVADLITGYGVAESVRHFYNIWETGLDGKRVLVQGWGNVGGSAAYFLAMHGAKIIGILDKEMGVYAENGFDFGLVKDMYNQRSKQGLNVAGAVSMEDIDQFIWDMSFDVFIPAAASRLVTRNQVDRMINSQTELISCGANVPFKDPEIFFGPTAAFADDNISVIPDFIANCGMARVFAYLMASEVKLNDKDIFDDVSKVIEEALKDVYNRNSSHTRISRQSFDAALAELL